MENKLTKIVLRIISILFLLFGIYFLSIIIRLLYANYKYIQRNLSMPLIEIVFLIIFVIIALSYFISSYGTFRLKKWSRIFTIVISIISMILLFLVEGASRFRIVYEMVIYIIYIGVSIIIILFFIFNKNLKEVLK